MLIIPTIIWENIDLPFVLLVVEVLVIEVQLLVLVELVVVVCACVGLLAINCIKEDWRRLDIIIFRTWLHLILQ